MVFRTDFSESDMIYLLLTSESFTETKWSVLLWSIGMNVWVFSILVKISQMPQNQAPTAAFQRRSSTHSKIRKFDKIPFWAFFCSTNSWRSRKTLQTNIPRKFTFWLPSRKNTIASISEKVIKIKIGELCYVNTRFSHRDKAIGAKPSERFFSPLFLKISPFYTRYYARNRVISITLICKGNFERKYEFLCNLTTKTM